MVSWLGQVCLDLPYDEALPEVRVPRDDLEHPDGTMRHAGLRSLVMPLDHAMESAAHGEPGFRQRWAEDF